MYIENNYHALTQNALYFKRILGESKLCAVIKNNAYGHGLERVASYLAPHVDFFAVGNAEECQKIAYLGKNTLILLPQDGKNTELAIQYGGILTIDSFRTLAAVRSAVHKCNSIVKVHIKIDSGMSRLGFSESDMPKLLKLLKEDKNIEADGVFSHFFGDTAETCDKQLECFSVCADELEQGLNTALIKHIANTSGALLSSKYRLDMARIGIGLFGYGARELLPCKRVYSDVIAVKSVRQGETVGYGGVYECKKDTKIAVVRAGYADGLPRMLAGSRVKINGGFYPIVAVCMAMCMVDVGGSCIEVGDSVTLLGDGVNLSNDKVITYELLCSLR